MALVSLNAVRKSYGSRIVLDELDFAVVDGARIGVVGANGAGKSTLLKLLVGLEEPDAGTSVRRRGVVISFVPQHPVGDARTPLETVRAARPDLDELDRELNRVTEQLAEPDLAGDLDRMARVLRRQEELVERWEAAGGPSIDGRARATLLDLGIAAADLALSTNVLLLDEPEAHLDAVGRALVERLIATFDGAVVAVSHDRYLLDETIREIAELDRGRIRTWPGNYSAYTLARELELQRQQQLYVTQQKEIERLEEAIRRFRLWASWVPDKRHIRQAWVKQRQIDRMEKVDRPVLERRKIALRLHPHERGGQRVFELRHVEVRFGDDAVLDEVELTVMHGERVGVVGANGAGKSVLLKAVVGELEPTSGEVWVGPSIRVGYLAQDQETLDPDASPLETVRLGHRCSEGEAVSLLMKFLFPYEQVRRANRLLSGGERTRLQLLLLMLQRPNLLVLDEPTNHLDIDSVEALEAALEEFDGTVCVISHDRYFLDRIVDRIVEVRDGEALSFDGSWSDWYERVSAREEAATPRV
jgi:ATP-binding cassette, subfamily F, member 3